MPSFITMVEMALAKQRLDSVANEIKIFSQLNIPDSVYGVQYARRLCEGIQLWQDNQKEKALISFNNLDNIEGWPDKSGLAKSSSVVKHIILYTAYHQLGQEVIALEQIRESEQLAKEYGFADV